MENGQEDMREKNFKDELLDKLNEFRKMNILCDTTIRAEGQDFAAHKCVLSAVSPYFRAMFTSQMKETQNSLVELQEEKSTAVRVVLEFIYTGEVKINSSNAQDIVKIADYLIIPSLKTTASLFLEGTVNVSNCLALESFACQYNCESLKEVAITHECENFVEIAISEDFRMLDLEKVQELICKDEINVAEEEQVYQAVISWVKHDLPSRECSLPELLKCVRLFSMFDVSLRRILNEELIKKSPTCTSMVTNALDSKVLPNCLQDMPPKPRLSLNKYVVLTGGGSGDDFNTDTLCFALSTRTWLCLPSMPCYSSGDAGAVCDGKLYVLGWTEGEHENKSLMCCFNPEENKWSSSDLTLDLSLDFSVTCFKEQLYIIGGENYVCDIVPDVHVYNPALDRWRRATSMQTCRASHGAVVLDDHIYIIGGYNRQACLNSVECYNPLTDQWADVSSMSRVRNCAATTSACEKLVVVGGFGDMRCTVIEPSCEIFDLSTNQWSLVSGPRVPRAICGVVSVDDVIYLFGGVGGSNCLNSVECFDIAKNEWYQLEPMPNPLSEAQASLLKISNKFIHSYSSI